MTKLLTHQVINRYHIDIHVLWRIYLIIFTGSPWYQLHKNLPCAERRPHKHLIFSMEIHILVWYFYTEASPINITCISLSPAVYPVCLKQQSSSQGWSSVQLSAHSSQSRLSHKSGTSLSRALISWSWGGQKYGTHLLGYQDYPDSKVHGPNMGPIWGRQDPGGPHVGPMSFAIWVPRPAAFCSLVMLPGIGILMINKKWSWDHLDGFVQDCSNSSVAAMELLQSCTEPPILSFSWESLHS